LGCRSWEQAMNNALTIRDSRKSIIGDYNEVSADVDGDRIFFRAPLQYELASRGEPFLGIALLEAMIRNMDIWVEDSLPLSEKLYKILPEIQTIYACWNSDLHKVNIHARIDPSKDTHEHVASFFSAGVDSSHTLYRNMTEITHLVMLSGFEEGTPESWRKSVEKQTMFARTIGKELIPIETNAKQWTDRRKILWAFAQGLILSSMGPLLKAKRVYIASSHTYNELFPWGSHPLTDPMWSTESTEVIHDGAASRRGDKLRELCKNQKLLDNLQVCWQSDYDNCGECPNCVRTITALYFLGASSQALPNFDNNLSKLKILRGVDESSATFLEDAMILAKNARNNAVLRILRRYYLESQIFQVLRKLDRYVLRGILRRIYRTIAQPNYVGERVNLKGSQRWEI
jgi:hypothetical protein